MSHLKDVLKFESLLENCRPWKSSSSSDGDGGDDGQPAAASTAVAALNPTRPSAAGLTWLAVPKSNSTAAVSGGTRGLAFCVVANGSVVQAIRITDSETISVLGSYPLTTTADSSTADSSHTAGIVHLACSPDGRMLAAATSDGSLICLDVVRCSSTGESDGGNDEESVHISHRWTLQNFHSHCDSKKEAPHVSTNLNATPSASRQHGAVASGPIHSLQFSDGYTLLLVDAGRQGSLVLLQADVAGGPTIIRPQQTLADLQVTCAAWEPRDTSSGQQQRLVVGDAMGQVHLYQYNDDDDDKASGNNNNNNLESISTNVIPFPGENDDSQGTPPPFACTHLDWFSPTSIAAGYCRVLVDDDEDDDDDDEDEQDDLSEHQVELFILDFDATDMKTGDRPTHVSSLGDVVPFFSVPKAGRHVFYTCAVPTTTSTSGDHHPILLVAANVASDVAVVAKDENGSNEWQIVEVPEGNNVTCPTDEDDEFTYALGIGMVGGDKVLLAATDGSLSCFTASHETNATFFATTTTTASCMTLPTTPVEAVAAASKTTPAPPPEPVAPVQEEANKPSIFGSAPGEPTKPSIFGGATTSGTTGSSSSFGSGLATSSFLGSNSSGGAPVAPSPLFTSTPVSVGESIFGMTSSLGPKANDDQPAPVSTSAESTAPVFGSGSKAPSFGFASSSGTDGGSGEGFAALAASGEKTTSGAFGGAAATATATSSGNDGRSSPFNIFGSNSLAGPSSGLSSMAKPLFGGASTDDDHGTTTAPPSSSSSSSAAFGGAATARKPGLLLSDMSKPLFASAATTTTTASSVVASTPAPASSALGGAATTFKQPILAIAPAPDPADPFGKSSSSSTAAMVTGGGLLSMTKPLFGGSSTTSTTTTTAATSGADMAVTTTKQQQQQPWSAALNPLGGGSGFSFGDAGGTSAAAVTSEQKKPDTSVAVKSDETRDERAAQDEGGGEAVPLDSSSSMEAKKAAAAFDLIDKSKSGLVALEKLEELVEELGEGFYGKELEEQAALMVNSPNNNNDDDSGQQQPIKRAAFIAWYVKLSSQSHQHGNSNDGGGDDGSSVSSGERAEREEQATECREKFTALSKDGGKTIKTDDFPQLMESFGTTFCADGAHGRAQKKLSSMDGLIAMDDFIAWYLDWFFGEDDESDDDDDNEQQQQQSSDTTAASARVTSTAGWGNMFAAKEGSWKCSSCMVSNDDPDATKCVACEAPREGATAPMTGQSASEGGSSTIVAKSSSPSSSSSAIGPGGFTFGRTAAPSGGFSFGAPSGGEGAGNTASNSTGIGKGGFTFGGTSSATVPSASADAVESSSPEKGVADAAGAKSEVLDSTEAERAAEAFDSVDTNKKGVLSRAKLDDLLEKLGEGFYGEELDAQVAIMDPGDSGQLKRSVFIDWYVLLSQRQTDSDDNGSMDSDEREEREEETQKCRECFSALSEDSTTIKAEDFPTLIESCGTTYCEDGAHGRAQKKLSRNGVIRLDDFISWYLDWFFGEDDESDDEDEGQPQPVDATSSRVTSTAGWGNIFAAKDGSWKCESCMVWNDDPNATKCVACETQRKGGPVASCQASNEASDDTTKKSSSTIGPGGFSFGGTAPSDGFSFGVPGASAKKPDSSIGPSGFSFGGAAAPTGSSGAAFGNAGTSSSGGFSFGGLSPAAGGSSSTAAEAAGASSGTGFSFGKPGQADAGTKTQQKASGSAYPPLSSIAPTPVEAVKPSTISSSEYPPMSKTAPKAVGATISAASGASSAYPPMSKTAPTPVAAPMKTASSSSAYPPMSKTAPTPVAALKKLTSASSAYPPMSKSAPTPVAAPKKTTSSSSAYPPMSKTAPTPVAATKKSTSASLAYPPMSKTAPTPVPAAKNPISSSSVYPPMSKAAPTPVGGAVKSTASSSYPPMSRTAPTPVGAPAPATSSTKSQSIFGAPASTTTSNLFGTSATLGFGSASQSSSGSMFGTAGAPPSTGFSFGQPPQGASVAKLPSPFGQPKTSSNSAYPPMSKTAPTPVGAPKAAASSSAYPPVSKSASKELGSSAPASSAYPPVSKAAPTPVGAPKVSASSAYPPMSKAAPTPVGVGALKLAKSSSGVCGRVALGSALTASFASSQPPTSSMPRSVPQKIETMSDCTAEYARLVSKMQESLDRVASGLPDGKENELRASIENLVHGVTTVLASFGKNNASLEDCKGTSARVLAKTDDALRKAKETQRLIDERMSNTGNDFLRTQPLDASSEKLQRAIAAHGVLFDRCLSLVHNKSLLVDELHAGTSEDAKIALAKALVDITPKIKSFDDASKEMEVRSQQLSSLRSGFLLSPNKPVTTLTNRHGSKMITTSRNPTTFNRRLLHLKSSSFDEIRSTRVKSFGLGRKLPKSREKPKRRMQAANHVAAQSRDAIVQPWSPQQLGSSTPVFAPSEPAHHRARWDKISKVDQTRAKQVSFSSPKELREVSLDSAARDALSSFGTTPEKARGAIAIQNRKDMSAVPRRAASSKPSAQPRGGDDSEAFSKAGGKLPAASTFSLLSTSKPAPLESSGSIPAKTTSIDQQSSSDLLPSFSSGAAKSSVIAAPKMTEAGPSKSSGTGAAETTESGSAFGRMASLGSSSLFATSTGNQAELPKPTAKQTGEEAPDYASILATFYQTHNPTKAGDAKKMVEKYKGREVEMFMKLGKKYNVPSPLEALKDSTASAPASGVASNLASPSLSVGPAPASTPFSSQAKPPLAPAPSLFGSSVTPAPASITSPFSSPTPTATQSTFGGTPPGFGSTSSGFSGMSAPTPAFGSSGTPGPAPAFGSSSTPAPAFGSSSAPAPAFGGATTQSPFGGGSVAAGSPSPFGAPAPATSSATTFAGRMPRELLMAFYQKYNAAKLAEVDKFLTKYQGKEEHMFRQLAKKYNLDPSVFGLSAAPPAATTPGFANTTPGGFGQPTVLGGGPAFGGAAAAPTLSPFGASASPGGFGQPAVLGGGPVGTPAGAPSFGAASGMSFGAGATSFGSLAHSPGAAAPGGFGSPSATSFGASTPFGAARR